jgi:DNA replication licensing factor MCM4
VHQLARYVTYAREYCHPLLTEAAGRKIAREYLSLRAIGISRKTITATPRQLESLIRLSEAFAKMRLSSEVNEDDVERAVTLVLSATLKSATDPNTGIIDLDIITTGRSSAIKQRIEEVAEFAKAMLLANEAKYRKGTYLEQFMEEFSRHGGVSSHKEPVTR